MQAVSGRVSGGSREDHAEFMQLADEGKAFSMLTGLRSLEAVWRTLVDRRDKQTVLATLVSGVIMGSHVDDQQGQALHNDKKVGDFQRRALLRERIMLEGSCCSFLPGVLEGLEGPADQHQVEDPDSSTPPLPKFKLSRLYIKYVLLVRTFCKCPNHGANACNKLHLLLALRRYLACYAPTEPDRFLS